MKNYFEQLKAVETAVLGNTEISSAAETVRNMSTAEVAAIYRDARATADRSRAEQHAKMIERQLEARAERQAERQKAINAINGASNDTEFKVQPGAKEWRAAYGGASGIVSAKDMYPRAWFETCTIYSANVEFYRARTVKEASAALWHAIQSQPKIQAIWVQAARQKINNGRVVFAKNITAKLVQKVAAQRVLSRLVEALEQSGTQSERTSVSWPEGISTELPKVRVLQEFDQYNRPQAFARLEIDGHVSERVRLLGLEQQSSTIYEVAPDDDNDQADQTTKKNEDGSTSTRRDKIRTGTITRMNQRPAGVPQLQKGQVRKMYLERKDGSIRVYGIGTKTGELWFCSKYADFEGMALTVSKILKKKEST
jgi:hypothetical protein